MDKQKVLIGTAIVAVLVGGGLYLREQSFNRLSQMTLRQNEAGGYTFDVDGKPFVMKGVVYNPVPVGKDYLYNFWADDIWKEDGKLMKRMGVNTIRLYTPGKNPEEVKGLIRGMYRRYGIRSLLGHYLGFMDWPPANYSQENFRKKITKQVLDMVRTYKDEAGIMAWVLGNENNYSFDLNVRPWSSIELDAIEDTRLRNEAKARIYYTFVNGLARKLKEIDPARPVIMGVGEVRSLHIAAEAAPDIDIIGIIAYRGPTFGNLFRQVRQKFDKPVVLIEWGADRYNALTKEEDEISQSEFIKAQWNDIQKNLAAEGGKGNVLGGTLFEWHDEWWKSNENLAHTWVIHEKTGQWSSSAYYYDYEVPGRANMNEEWWGIVGLKPQREASARDIREPKKGYYTLKELWK